MTDDPKVILHVKVSIDYDDPEYDTGYTLSAWNAMTDRERSAVLTSAWEGACQSDDGGIWPTTPGAKS